MKDDYDREACLIAEVANLSRGELEALTEQEWRPLAERAMWRGMEEPPPGWRQCTEPANWEDLCRFHTAVHDSVVAIAEGGTWHPRPLTAEDWPIYRREVTPFDDCGIITRCWETSEGTPASGVLRSEEANMERFLSKRGRWPFAHCPECGRLFFVRSVAKFCSKSCGRKNHRKRGTPTDKAKRAAYMRNWRKK